MGLQGAGNTRSLCQFECFTPDLLFVYAGYSRRQCERQCGHRGGHQRIGTSRPTHSPPPHLTRSGRLQPPASHVHSERAVTTARVTHCIHVVASLLVRYSQLKPNCHRLNVDIARRRPRKSTVANRAPANYHSFPKYSGSGRSESSKTSPTTRKLLSGDLVRKRRAA